MAELPNLKGVATQDLVESIGSGRFSASYINWSRTMQLFRENAPGWQVETLFAADGTLLHKAPVGGYLLLRLRHLDGSCTPEVPQAVMDNRNNAIPYEKITARDITDTQRRGACLVLAMQTGLAHELWAKMPLESGYQQSEELETQQSVKPQSTGTKKTSSTSAPVVAADAKVSKTEFVNLAKEMGLVEPAIKDLISKINDNYANGIKTLKSKDDKFVLQMNERFQASEY
jgi:hypothetical protein